MFPDRSIACPNEGEARWGVTGEHAVLNAMSERTKWDRYQPILVTLLCLNFGILFFERNALNFLMPFVQPALALTQHAGGCAGIGILAPPGPSPASWSASRFSDRTGTSEADLIVVDRWCSRPARRCRAS